MIFKKTWVHWEKDWQEEPYTLYKCNNSYFSVLPSLIACSITHINWIVSCCLFPCCYLQRNMPRRILPFRFSRSACVDRRVESVVRRIFWSKRISEMTVVLMYASTSDLTASVFCFHLHTASVIHVHTHNSHLYTSPRIIQVLNGRCDLNPNTLSQRQSSQ